MSAQATVLGPNHLQYIWGCGLTLTYHNHSCKNLNCMVQQFLATKKSKSEGDKEHTHLAHMTSDNWSHPHCVHVPGQPLMGLSRSLAYVTPKIKRHGVTFVGVEDKSAMGGSKIICTYFVWLLKITFSDRSTQPLSFQQRSQQIQRTYDR